MPRQAASSTLTRARPLEPETVSVSFGLGMRLGFAEAVEAAEAAVPQETPGTRRWPSWRVGLELQQRTEPVNEEQRVPAATFPAGPQPYSLLGGMAGCDLEAEVLGGRQSPHIRDKRGACLSGARFQAPQPVISVVPNLKLEGSCALKASCRLPGTEKWGWGDSGWGRVCGWSCPLEWAKGCLPHLLFVPGMSVFSLCAWCEHGVRKVQMRWVSELLWGLK